MKGGAVATRRLAEKMAGVLDGIRVVDVSHGVAGPMTTMMLADNGADVVRVERGRDEPAAGQTGLRVWNRGKRSVEIDLESGAGQDALATLLRAADVVVHTPSGIESHAVRAIVAAATVENPRLIVCSISGYGDHPLHRDRPDLDGLVAARTGLLFDQKGRRGTPMEFISGRPGPLPELDASEGLVRGADRPGPVFPRTPWPSIGATYLATLGVMAALRARELTGRGQVVETSLLRGALAATCLNWQRVEDPDAPLYWMWPADARSIEGLYECADGRWVHHWTVRPSWVLSSAEGDDLVVAGSDGLYRDDPDRISMEPDGLLVGTFLHPQLAEAFKKFPSADWVAAGDAAQMGVALVRSPAQALADEAFLADGCVVEVVDPELGSIRLCGPLLELSDAPGAVRAPAPRRGQHTAEVLAEAAWAPAPAPTGAGATLAHPLTGVRVIDLGLGVAGPFAGRMLADLGADVVKVNAKHDVYWCGTHMGLGTNRGKRSIALDLKHESGRAILERLIESSDVVTMNWRPGAAARLGLDYETLTAKYPKLVYCSSRGYERGPRSDLPGTDQTAAALTGTEWEDGACDAGNPPLWSRSNMGDTGNALLSAIAITAALYHRDRTGRGQQVGTSIVNAGLLHTSYAWIHADGTPSDWGHVDGGQHGLSCWYRLFECAEGTWIFLAALDAVEQATTLAALGADAEVRDDPDALTAALEHGFRTRSAAEWFALLDAASVPVEVVDEEFCRNVFDDPHARADELIAETSSGAVGRFEDPGLLVRFSETPGVIQRGPSMCGEHSRDLLVELGYADGEIDAFVEGGAILDAPVVKE
ncbi:MAG: CoA transferase [Actinobacteria bacterium]|nr:MAG: CoA transferase [Actinomycetota bacterium]